MSETGTSIALVGPSAGMFDAWFSLYERYAADAGVQPSRRVGGILWRWLLDGTYRVAGVIAVDNRKDVVGFAHYRPFPNTLDGTEACRLDDIYVASEYRDNGLTERLIEHVCNTARKRGWSEVNWSAPTDLGMRAAFDNVATRVELAMYRVDLGR